MEALMDAGLILILNTLERGTWFQISYTQQYKIGVHFSLWPRNQVCWEVWSGGEFRHSRQVIILIVNYLILTNRSSQYIEHFSGTGTIRTLNTQCQPRCSEGQRSGLLPDYGWFFREYCDLSTDSSRAGDWFINGDIMCPIFPRTIIEYSELVK